MAQLSRNSKDINMTATKWTGEDAGVREPMTGETPLSPSEIAVGLRDGIFSPPRTRPLVKQAMPAQKQADQIAEETYKAPPARRQPVRDLVAGSTTSLIREALEAAGPGGLSLTELQEKLAAQRTAKVVEAAGNNYKKSLTRPCVAICSKVLTMYFEHGSDPENCQNVYDERLVRVNADRKAAREAYKERQRQRDERINKEKKEARAEAKKLRMDAVVERAKEPGPCATKSKAPKSMKKATAAINKIADKYRGTVSPSAIPKEPKKYQMIEIPEHLITRIPGMKLPHELLKPAGAISHTIGVYEGAPSPWVKAVAA